MYYEKIPAFWYLCGRMGHVVEECEATEKNDEGKEEENEYGIPSEPVDWITIQAFHAMLSLVEVECAHTPMWLDRYLELLNDEIHILSLGQ